LVNLQKYHTYYSPEVHLSSLPPIQWVHKDHNNTLSSRWSPYDAHNVPTDHFHPLTTEYSTVQST